MKKQGVYAWVCFCFFIVLVVWTSRLSPNHGDSRNTTELSCPIMAPAGRKCYRSEEVEKLGSIITEQLTLVSMVPNLQSRTLVPV